MNIKYDRCQRELNNAQKVMNDPAYKMDREAYIELEVKNARELWEHNLIRLADDCLKFDLDTKQLSVMIDEPTERGFICTIRDGKPRRIYARFVFCAENSDYVSPHFRYIITTKEERDLRNEKLKMLEDAKRKIELAKSKKD